MTSDQSEWDRISDGLGTDEDPFWQHRDNPNAISHDEGKTYYMIDEPTRQDGSPIIYNTDLRPVSPAHYPKDLAQAVYQTVGTASVCWESMEGTGVFDDASARQAADDLIEWINKHYDKKKEPVSG